MNFAAFGCALDALDSGESLSMKLAFASALERGLVGGDIARDPFDLLEEKLASSGRVKSVGKVDVPSWLWPRPEPSDAELLTPERYREFTESGGLEQAASSVRDFIENEVFPARPLMVAVDHSMTGGALEALAGDRELALVVFDAHLDAIPAEIRRLASGAEGGEVLPDAYDCGTWLAEIISRGIVPPERLVVAGVSDRPGETGEEGDGYRLYADAYAAVEGSLLAVVTKKRLREEGPSALDDALHALDGCDVYVSIDADVAAGPYLKAVRFMDTMGLEPDELIGCVRRVAAAAGDRIAGVDVAEIDVHLADIPGGDDRTVEVMTSVAAALTGAD